MKKILLIIMFCSSINFLQGQEIEMRNWTFEWVVLEAFNTQLKIIKTDDILKGQFLRNESFSSDRIDFYPEDAPIIADIFLNAEGELEKLKTKYKETREPAQKIIPINSKIVGIYYFGDTGAAIFIAENSKYSPQKVLINREAAKMFAEKLQLYKEYFGAVEKRISP